MATYSLIPSLQISVAVLAVVSMPLCIAVLNLVYAGHASIAPWHVAPQVFVAQLLPLGLGIALRRIGAPARGCRMQADPAHAPTLTQ